VLGQSMLIWSNLFVRLFCNNFELRVSLAVNVTLVWI
jgi:hypothetical protein